MLRHNYEIRSLPCFLFTIDSTVVTEQRTGTRKLGCCGPAESRLSINKILPISINISLHILQ